jgi:3alpha(or 20beta)-hydroxysteroid dehydrogenase
MGRLDGKVAIVTGAAGGMGEGYARVFGREGAKVVMTDVNAPKLDGAYDKLKALGYDVIRVHQDVAFPEQWDMVMEQALAAYGTVDILINNAGVAGAGAHLRNLKEPGKLEFWKRVTDIQLYGPIYGMSRVLPVMVKNRKGVIINISSLAAYGAMGGSTAYTAAKSAIIGLSRSAASGNAKYNIRVNVIVPGIILTDMMEEFKNPDSWWMKQELKRIKLDSYGTPEDTANAALFLVSDEARYITGVVLPVDGGYLCGYPLKDKD